MSDINPVTKADLLAAVSKSLGAQQALRDRMAQVAAETAASKAQATAQGAPK